MKRRIALILLAAAGVILGIQAAGVFVPGVVITKTVGVGLIFVDAILCGAGAILVWPAKRAV